MCNSKGIVLRKVAIACTPVDWAGYRLVEVINVNLGETVGMMSSEDYKERFKAEYLQLKIRMHGLSSMLQGYREGTLTFVPSCSYDLLNAQFKAMALYASFIEDRAKVEDIELGNDFIY